MTSEGQPADDPDDDALGDDDFDVTTGALGTDTSITDPGARPAPASSDAMSSNFDGSWVAVPKTTPIPSDKEKSTPRLAAGATPVTIDLKAAGSAADFAAFVRDDVKHWAPIVKQSGAKPD